MVIGFKSRRNAVVTSDLLQRPGPCDHLIQAYTDDRFLAEVVTEYLAAGFRHGEGAVVITTPAHGALFMEHLVARGIDSAAAVDAGTLLVLDAAATLRQFMVDGAPDQTLFFGVVAPALDRVRATGCGGIRLYGEMVDLLWSDNLPGTVQLEELWNQVLVDTRLSLLCAYRMDPLDARVRGVLRQVTRCHSHLVPIADYGRFADAVNHAYAEVFGADGDVTALREQMVTRADLHTAMPAAHAAMFALDQLPPVLSNELRKRTQAFYRRETVA
jgi:hypothetical protein